MSGGTTPRPARVIGILGAESTGKTALAQALASQLAAATGLRCTWVSEWLRHWCEAEGRTPRADEQADIARAQHARIDAAAATHDLVIADTTALMTAVYSQQFFGDDGLDTLAVALHRRCDATLLTAPDLAWQPDPLRDGPAVRAQVDTRLRDMLTRHALPWHGVQGLGAARVGSALAALAPLLAR
ncbi:ATP-binding protein [Ideonella sp. DXS22W]|uniref:ATP-binding protein n=1 Tax=Pseudaquabacterium inlustre TaxID=2984192 RepID=A0ABU9CAK0_9BURK